MQKTSIPAKFLVPWAQNDTAKVEIPVTTTDPTRASQSLGFPPLTEQPPEVGGVPPQGEDFNGGMNQIARAIWWMLQGGGFPYDSAFANASQIGGYINSAVIPRADGRGYWLSTADNNLTNPDATDGTAANWVPLGVYGTASISVSSTDVTVYPVQAAFQTLLLSGTLTANRNVILPAWTYEWKIIDNTVRGGFTLTVKTATGSGVAISTGSQLVRGDGTNIVQNPQSIAPATLTTQAVTLGQLNTAIAGVGAAAVVGTIKNFKSAVPGINSYTTVLTADEVILENGSNAYMTVRNVNLTVNANGTVGAPLSVMSARTASTWYYRWLWYNSTNGLTATLDASSTAPTAPTGYSSTDYKCRLPGASRTDSSANTYLLQIETLGKRSQYVPLAGSNVTLPPQMASGNSTYGSWTAVGVTAFVPTTASAISFYAGATSSGSGSNGVAVAPNSVYSTTTTAPATMSPWVAYQGATNSTIVAVAGVMLLESANIYWQGQASNNASSLNCLGWEEA